MNDFDARLKSTSENAPENRSRPGTADESASAPPLQLIHAIMLGGTSQSSPRLGNMTVVNLDRGRKPKARWKDILFGMYRSLDEDRVLAVAAGVTFYGLLAVFPAIGAVVSLYGLIADSATIRDNLDRLSSFLPGGAIDVIGEQVARITAAGSGALGISFIISLAVAIWGANAGVKAVFDAINVAYGAKEERGFFKLNLISLAFTLGALLFAVIALLAIVVVPIAIHTLGMDTVAAPLLTYGRWPVVWLLVAFALAVLYRFGPTDTLNPKWHWITWGSGVASLLWIVASALFSYYASNFGNYNATYGSLGAVIGLMTWIWISATVIILGAELNSEIEKAAGESHAQRPKNDEKTTRTA
jgi:membrane protein